MTLLLPIQYDNNDALYPVAMLLLGAICHIAPTAVQYEYIASGCITTVHNDSLSHYILEL